MVKIKPNFCLKRAIKIKIYEAIYLLSTYFLNDNRAKLWGLDWLTEEATN